jgi:hypothetical protein
LHILERYSLNTASKINKTFIYEQYFPLPLNRYITFQSQSKFESKDYNYWQDCLDIITPILNKVGIQIVQIGTQKEQGYKRLIDLRGQTNFHQLAYIVKNSELYLGPDSFGAHLASTYDKFIVALYSCIQSNNAGPYFGNKSKHILFDAYKRMGNGKPSYSAQEFPKSINTIKPEEIAESVFKLLKIDFKVPFETVHIGNRYGNSIVREIIPNCGAIVQNPELQAEIRADLYCEEKFLIHQLANLKKVVVIIDDKVNIDVLKKFKPNIQMIGYKIRENDNLQYVKDLIEFGFNIILLSELPDEEIQQKKLKYFEYGNINKVSGPSVETVDKLKKDINLLYYRSNKLVISKDKIFSGHAAEQNNIVLNNDVEYQKVIDCPEFWKDLDFMSVIKKLDK